MAIQPIDLQTLFTQMDKVARQKSAEKEGLVLQQSLQGAVNLKKTEEKVRSVNETKEPEGGAERIKDNNARNRSQEEFPEKKEEKKGPNEEKQIDVIQDPDLGKHIDVNG
ncbi:hypothetical protein [Gracilinema caldarium]|uniref:Uncharacterized protein n=1 Tax=Gracilinema caldarium (strain ATCC 51460 / DSM 7334 / H1) TaxID=744872 RepID=F8EZ71_GRAC1|nr:hypothetical protein [Gracilinema caldarium]AEJ19663.1 hypothetical protein Spica_1519 [Gracilinema caldarium DSM 7334]